MSKKDRNPPRRSKKTEMLEVRVSPEEKTAFLQACQNVGRSASEVIRDAMRAYSDFGPMGRFPRSSFVLVSAFVGATLGAFALVSYTSDGAEADVNYAVSYQQFRAFDQNQDNILTRSEFRNMSGGFRETVSELVLSDPDALTKRASAVATVFGGLDINIRAIMNSADELSEACWEASEVYYGARLDAEFGRFDLNGDGEVPAAEYAEHRRAELFDMFERSDVNEDGFITFEDGELRAAADQERAASNPTRIEFTAEQPEHIRICQPDVGPWDSEGISSSSMANISAEGYWRPYANWDANNDGAIDFDEYAINIAGR